MISCVKTNTPSLPQRMSFEALLLPVCRGSASLSIPSYLPLSTLRHVILEDQRVAIIGACIICIAIAKIAMQLLLNCMYDITLRVQF